MACQFNQNYFISGHTCVYLGDAVVPDPTDTGLTLVAWFNVPSFGVTNTLVSIYSTVFNRHTFSLQLFGFNGPGEMTVVGANLDGASTEIANSANQYSFDTWHMGAAVFEPDNGIPFGGGITAYLDGVPGVFAPSVIPNPILNETAVGGFRAGSLSDFSIACGGCIARALIYNATLTDGDIASLYAGANPKSIDGLVTYLGLVNSATAADEISVPETWGINITPGSLGITTCETSPFFPTLGSPKTSVRWI